MKQMENKTTISLKNIYGDREHQVTISVNYGDLEMKAFLEDLVIPLLRAVGFAEETIRDHIEYE